LAHFASDSHSLIFLPLHLRFGLNQAFCSISTGVYGYPIGPATRVALDTVREFLATERGSTVGPRSLASLFLPSYLSLSSTPSLFLRLKLIHPPLLFLLSPKARTRHLRRLLPKGSLRLLQTPPHLLPQPPRYHLPRLSPYRRRRGIYLLFLPREDWNGAGRRVREGSEGLRRGSWERRFDGLGRGEDARGEGGGGGEG